MTSYTKLRDGSWGLRGSASDLQPGMPVRVEKRDGSIREEIIGAVIWSGEDVGGNRIAIATIRASWARKSAKIAESQDLQDDSAPSASLRQPKSAPVTCAHCGSAPAVSGDRCGRCAWQVS